MWAEFYRADAPDEVVGRALWDGTRVRVEAEADEVSATLQRVFRLSPVAVVDASTRPVGSGGDTVVEPGDLQWFIIAAGARAQEAGLGVRLVAVSPGGWDPASAYLPMGKWIERRQGSEKAPALGTPSE